MKRKEWCKKLFCMMLVSGLGVSMIACGNIKEAENPANRAPQIQSVPKEPAKNAVEHVREETEGICADVAFAAAERTDDFAGDYLTGAVADGCFPEEIPWEDFNTEEYNAIRENRFVNVATNAFSTFAIDVDTGSYTNLRRMVSQNYLMPEIPGGAVRIEEMLNYFDYDVTNKSDGKFSVQSEIHACPWNEENELLLLTVQANEVEVKNEGNNFVYLIDTSGSMSSRDKINLALEGFKLLSASLDPQDKVSIVTYAGDSATLLEGCPAADYKKIADMLDQIDCHGGTNGSGGIEAAYKVALKNYIEGGNNRVILASDGDMNLGVTSQSGLVELIKEKKDQGIFLTTLGFGSGNYSDANMEQIADAGNGNYFYIDCIGEAERVLVEKLKETTVTVAKDVKIQVEFNPEQVKSYRLIGYENRVMSADDFKDDTVDGGEVGAGQQVTVLYELSKKETDTAPESRYQTREAQTTPEADGEVLNVAIRYKEVQADTSVEEQYAVCRAEGAVSDDFWFAAGVANASMQIRGSEYAGAYTMKDAMTLAQRGTRENVYREEFVWMLRKLCNS